MTSKRHWQAHALALAAAAVLSLPAPEAQALALGRVTVQSALGEPLRADIDLPEITPDEVSSLRATVASPEAFRAAGLEYSPALSNVSITLQRRPDGRHFLRLASDRAVNEPFVDIILEARWSSGRIVRDFTMLFDPPALRQGQQQPLTAQTTPVAPRTAAPAPSAAPAAPPEQRARAAAPAGAAKPPASPSPAAPAEGKQVTVQSGDTAGRIAAANKPATVSLDQMLVAMLRSNPDAFADGNVNRLRAGAVLNLPTQEQAEAVSPAEARQAVVAQSRDFNEFRRRLAESLPAAPAARAEREARGSVQAKVEDKQSATAAPDKLTLSKGAVQGKAGEERIARERAAQDAASRVAELNRNLSELKGLTAAASAPKSGQAAGTAPPASAPGGPAVPLGTPAAAAVAAASAPAAAASAPAPVPAAAASGAATAEAPAAAASGAALPASAPAAAAPAPAVKKPVAPPPEPSLVDDLLENPLVPAALGGVLALLLGLGAWKLRQRRKVAAVDSSFLESRLQPDSFFGASGGQRVDTNEGAPTGSSMVYSPSQLDAAGDVDPVAEADVYLAYGRDLQAEEILKEALRINPQRVAIHTKLLEIYAKRRDTKAFEQIASEAYGLTHGEGPEWARVCELGLELDPANPMYQPGGQPSGAAPLAATAAAAAAAPVVDAPAPVAQTPAPGASGVDLDLDLDFSLGDDEPAAAAMPAPAATDSLATQPVVPPPAATLDAPLDMDFAAAAEAPATQPVRLDTPEPKAEGNALDFDMPLDLPSTAASAPVAAAPAQPADSGMLEFDLGGLSLDLGTPSTQPAPTAEEADSADAPVSTAGLELPAIDGEDPLATKLALAQEFNAIGDADGARSLAQEVIAEASGDLKSRAQKFLAEIG